MRLRQNFKASKMLRLYWFTTNQSQIKQASLQKCIIIIGLFCLLTFDAHTTEKSSQEGLDFFHGIKGLLNVEIHYFKLIPENYLLIEITYFKNAKKYKRCI